VSEAFVGVSKASPKVRFAQATRQGGTTAKPRAQVDVVQRHVAATVNDSAFSVAENGSIFVAGPGVLANADNPSGNTLAAILLTSTTHGSLWLNADGSFTDTPNFNFAGTDAFTYLASDGKFSSNLATVTLTVVHVNLPPTVENDSFTTSEIQTLVVPALGILGSAVDPNGLPLTAVLVNTTLDGSLALNSNGGFTYVPTAGFSGTDRFTFRATNGVLSSNLGTVTITVTPFAPTTVQLNPVSDTGESSTDRITRDTTPNFDGTTGAGLTVIRYAQLASVPGSPIEVGQTTADAAGNH
jgi:hypothetical protein